MFEKLISVIVPIYNVENYLEKCINSIINQSYNNLEIILVDDGSTDNCGIICDMYKEIDNRIIVIHKSNGGLSSARNVGLDISKGDLISFVDSDDYIEKTFLEELKNNMDKYKSDISVCNYYRVKNNNLTIGIINNNEDEYVLTDKDKFENIVNNYRVCVWNKLYKKSIFKNIRFPDGRIFEDRYVICDILNEAMAISYFNKPLYYYVYRSNSIVNKYDLNYIDIINAYNKQIEFYIKKGYHDLIRQEQNNKMNSIIENISKMKIYKINDKGIYNKYYRELVNTNKDVKWKDASNKVKLFKIFRKSSINVFSVMYKIRDLVRR